MQVLTHPKKTQGITSHLPSDHLRTLIIRLVTELGTRKFLPVLEGYMADNPAISSLQLLTIVYCYFVACAVQ